MLLRTWRFFTIMLTAIALAAALAHLMELPGKMTYDARLYVLLHRTLYPTFGNASRPESSRQRARPGYAVLSVPTRHSL